MFNYLYLIICLFLNTFLKNIFVYSNKKKMWEYKVYELIDGINDIWLGVWNFLDNRVSIYNIVIKFDLIISYIYSNFNLLLLNILYEY